MKAIHGTESSIARVQAALRKQPARSDSMTPMDAVYGIPFVTHETDMQAKEAAWKQAVEQRCKVAVIDNDKYYEIDGAAMGRMLDEHKAMRYAFSCPGPISFSIRSES